MRARTLSFISLCLAMFIIGRFIGHAFPAIQEGVWWVIHHILFG